MKHAGLPVLCLCLFLVLAVQGEDMRKVHCLGSSSPILLDDPFPGTEMAKVIAFYWFFTPKGSQVEETLMTVSFNTVTVENKRWTRHHNLGLQLQDPTVNDTGRYRASLTTTNSATDLTSEVSIIVVEPPALKTGQLAVTRKVNSATGEDSLTCGTLQSRGNPPVDLVWELPDGSLLDSVYANGNQTVVLNKDAEEGTYICKIDDESPAKECISPSQLDLWKAETIRQPEVGSAELNIIIIVVIVCVVILIIIVVVVIVVLIKQRKNKGNVYNTKDQEAKADNGQQGAELSHPLMIQDDANHYDRPNAKPQFYNYTQRPVSPGGHTASPYMVSGLNLPQGETGPMELPPKRNKKPPATESLGGAGRDQGQGQGKPGTGGGRYAKRGAAKNSGAAGDVDQADGKEPPTPKKRSIFLTDSMEGLDQIVEAV
ncbi:hypothetical protein EGW08_019551, partial [Elysia chlorotica]